LADGSYFAVAPFAMAEFFAAIIVIWRSEVYPESPYKAERPDTVFGYG
jgi:hypothetical protein